jgi:hypothetical protein
MRAFRSSPKVPITGTEAEKTVADEQPSLNPSRIQIATGDELSRRRYSNTMLVTRNAAEFTMEWLVENNEQAFH